MRNKRIQSSRKQKKLKNVDPFYRQEAKGTGLSVFKRKKMEAKEKKMIAEMRKQHVPKRMRDIMEFQQTGQTIQSKPKKKKEKKLIILKAGDEHEDVAGHKRSLKAAAPMIQQGLYETDEQFLHRLSKLAASAQAEAEIEDKFDVDFCEQNEECKLETTNEEPKKSNRKRKRNERKQQKRKEAKLKLKKIEEDDDLSVMDKVAFGEEVEEPPDLSFVKLKKKQKLNKS